MKNVEWDTAPLRKSVSLLVALAGTEGQFQFPLLMSVCLSACVHFGVFMFEFCCWGFLSFFVFVFVFVWFLVFVFFFK